MAICFKCDIHWRTAPALSYSMLHWNVQIMVQPIDQSPSTAFVLNTIHDGSPSLFFFALSSVMTSIHSHKHTNGDFSMHEYREFDDFILFFVSTRREYFLHFIKWKHLNGFDTHKKWNYKIVHVWMAECSVLGVPAISTNHTNNKGIVFGRPPRWRAHNILFYWTFSSQISRHFVHNALCATHSLALSLLNAHANVISIGRGNASNDSNYGISFSYIWI